MATIVNDQFYINHKIYTVNLHEAEIIVTVTASASVVRRWLASTLFFRRYYLFTKRLVVGLGVQWTPDGNDRPADTLQICIGRRCLIFQLHQADRVPMKLRQFLLNPNITFVGFWNHSDKRKLEESKHRLEMLRKPLDLRKHLESGDEDENLNLEVVGASVEEIVEKFLGHEVELRREISMSGWNAEFLTGEQVVYGCVDAYCAFLIGRNIRAWEIK